MRYFTTALVFLLTVSFTAQETISYPYNPDGNDDGYISVTDLQDLLVNYGYYFEAGEIMINDTTLSSYLSDLLLLIEANALPEGTASGQILVWDGNAWIPTLAMTGCTDSEACNYDSLATTFDNSCQYLDTCGVCAGPGDIYTCGCEDIPEGDCDCDGNQVDALNVCGGDCSADEDGDGICDDGDSCIGEADECGVCNGPGAIYDCGCSGIAEGECDCEGTADIDLDGICDPEDDCVGTPDAAGVCNGDCATDADGDGICDDNGNDTCDGNVDDCGVCNGPGPIYDCGCSDLEEGACDCAGNTPDEEGNCQDCLSDTDGDGLYDEFCGPCLGEISITYNGDNYGLVEIGGKCWFKENLRTTSYRSGQEIPHTPDEGEWNSLGHSGGYCAYDNDESNADTYGYLYNGYTTVSPEGVCPQFYAVPTLEEWDALIDGLGGSEVAGGALKESGADHWNAPNTGATNSSGFTALPAGGRSVGSAGFIGQEISGEFWVQGGYSPYVDQVDDYIVVKTLSSNSADISEISHSKVRGHSIRCLRADVSLGCTDVNFMEYDPTATADDGSCAVPALLGCMDDLFIEYDPSANVDDGSCSTLLGCSDSDVVEYDGYSYSLISIGYQCWFQENLKTSIYRDGSSIPNIQDQGEWYSLSATETGAWCYYNNNPDYDDNSNYGKLYNWYAIDDSRELCPSGWHVPSDSEFTELTDLLGGESVAGNSMKSTSGWYNGGNGSNSSGWSGFPGGYRYSGGFYYNGYGGYWWSASESGSLSWLRRLDYYYDGVNRYDDGQDVGFSARCVRD